MRIILKAIYIKAIIAIIAFLLALNLIIFYLFYSGPLKHDKYLIIPYGLAKEKVIDKLHNEGVIRTPFIFRIFLELFSLKNSIKSGQYKFTAEITPYQVIKILIRGKSVLHRLVIPEGVTIYEIVKIIEENSLLTGDIKNDFLEGYLMPDTYFYSYGDKKQRLIDKMRNDMSAALDELMPKLKTSSPLKNRMDVLILASIVEKEATYDSEKPIIASVYLNRLKKNMRLQADPTIIYAITEGKTNWNKAVYYKDLKFKSPYNTYINYGLPPGAISCPGYKSIAAVVNPKQTDYIYFVADGNGRHKFASNYKSHLKNVAIYRKLIKQRRLKSKKVKDEIVSD